MRLTFTLSDAQFTANDRAGVMVGLPLTVQLDAGPLVMGQDDTAGWFVRASYGPAALKPISLERVAFCGRIAQIEQWRSQEDVLCQALLDCGVPLRLDLLDPDHRPGQTGRPFDLETGDWLVGVARCAACWLLMPATCSGRRCREPSSTSSAWSWMAPVRPSALALATRPTAPIVCTGSGICNS